MAMDIRPLIKNLDPSLAKEMSIYRDASYEEEKFIAILLILKNPGLRPYVVSGLPREATLGAIDNLRENWWCKADDVESVNYWKLEVYPETDDRNPEVAFPFPEFVSDQQRTQARKELAALRRIGRAPNYLSQQILNWARTHPDDTYVPEALHWAVRATRYGCTDKETSTYSKAAFDLLHEKYPRNEWTARTKYHF